MVYSSKKVLNSGWVKQEERTDQVRIYKIKGKKLFQKRELENTNKIKVAMKSPIVSFLHFGILTGQVHSLFKNTGLISLTDCLTGTHAKRIFVGPFDPKDTGTQHLHPVGWSAAGIMGPFCYFSMTEVFSHKINH